jgi:hypothetical protein
MWPRQARRCRAHAAKLGPRHEVRRGRDGREKVARTSRSGIAAAENAADAETDIPLSSNRWILTTITSGLHQSFLYAREEA